MTKKRLFERSAVFALNDKAPKSITFEQYIKKYEAQKEAAERRQKTSIEKPVPNGASPVKSQGVERKLPPPQFDFRQNRDENNGVTPT